MTARVVLAFVVGFAAAAGGLGLVDRAAAAPEAVSERLAREQIQALREIAAEIKTAGRACR